MTITDLRKYTERINAKCEPTDKFRVTLNRAAMAYIGAILSDRKASMESAIADPKIKAAKRDKREFELNMITEAINALEKGERI